MTVLLKPCPRCGGVGEWVDYDDGPLPEPAWYVECTNAECGHRGDLEETQDEAAKSWNGEYSAAAIKLITDAVEAAPKRSYPPAIPANDD